MHGVKSWPVTKSKAADANGNLVIPANPNRVAILIGGTSDNTVAVSFGSCDDPTKGIVFAVGMQPILITERDVGEGVQADVTLQFAVATNVVLSWVEWVKGK